MPESKIKINYIPEIKAALFGRQKPAMVSVNLTNKCNQNCLYCEIGKNSPDKSDNLIDKYDMMWIIDQMASEGIKRLSMCGGEPFLFQGLTEIVKYAWSRNIKSNITSNGMAIYKLPEYDLKALSECHCQINISVDSFNPEIQSKTRGNQRALANAIQSIEILKKNKINVTLLSAISKYNYAELFYSFQTSYNLGINEVLYQPIISVSNYPDKIRLENKEKLNVPVAGVQEMNVQLDKILAFEKSHQIKTNIYRLKPWINEYISSVQEKTETPFYLKVLKKFHCREAHAVIDISYTGGIQPCGLAPAVKSIKDRNNQSLLELWNEGTINFKKDLKNQCFPDICKGCCHKFSRNMLFSVLRFPIENRQAGKIIFLLLLKRTFNNLKKKIKN